MFLYSQGGRIRDGVWQTERFKERSKKKDFEKKIYSDQGVLGTIEISSVMIQNDLPSLHIRRNS